MPSFDWNDASTLPKPGKYILEVTAAKLDIGRTSGHEYFRLTLKMVDGDEGNSVNDIISFSPAARGIAKRKLKALGLEGKQDIDQDDFIGKRVLGHVKHEDNMDGDTVLVIDISARDSQAGYEAITQQAPAQAENKAGLRSDFDDDIPF